MVFETQMEIKEIFFLFGNTITNKAPLQQCMENSYKNIFFSSKKRKRKRKGKRRIFFFGAEFFFYSDFWGAFFVSNKKRGN